MVWEGIYGFDPKQDNINKLMGWAKKHGIRISRNSLVAIRRSGWLDGFQTLERVSTTYQTFPEALRSLRHSIDKIFERAMMIRLMLADLKSFRDWLAEKAPDSEEKREQALSQLCDFVSRVSGVRCQNLVELKRHFAGDDQVTKTLEELLEDKQWGAACCTIVNRLNKRLRDEHRRLLQQIPRIAEKERVLGKIWEHDLWLAKFLRQRAISFGRVFDQARVSGNLELVLAELRALVKSFGRDPFYIQLKQNSLPAFWGLEQNLKKTGAITEAAEKLLRKGLYFLKIHEQWLLKQDSQVLPRQPEQRSFSKEAVF